MALSEIRQPLYQAFSSERAQAARGAWLNHLEKYRVPPVPITRQDSRWLKWGLLHTAAAAPFLSHLPAARRETGSLWQSVAAGNSLGIMGNVQRLLKTTNNSIQGSQNISDALRELFMANDRYQQARIEALYKEAEAGREQSKYELDDNINDLLEGQKYDGLIHQCISKMTDDYIEACRKIVLNF